MKKGRSPKLISAINQKFGSWTVLGLSSDLKRLRCQCDCGIVKDLHRNIIYKGRRCHKCYTNNNWRNKHHGWCGGKYISGTYWRNIVNSNSKRSNKDIKFLISLNEAEELLIKQDFKCALSGIPISFVDKTASLDRINSNKDYSVDNIQWVHKTINKMKTDLPQDEFLEFCRKITIWQNKDQTSQNIYQGIQEIPTCQHPNS
jgi:hypothetical protein